MIGRDQDALTADFVVLISDDFRCAAAVPGRDRADDPATAVAYEVLFQHLVVASKCSSTADPLNLSGLSQLSLVTKRGSGSQNARPTCTNKGCSA